MKGKLFEIEYTHYLNDGHLPSGYHASLAQSATQRGWDIEIIGPDGNMKDVIQAKATDSVGYVKHALEQYPHIDVVTTGEVYSQLMMQDVSDVSDHVINGGIHENVLHGVVHGATDAAAVHFTGIPSIISLSLIAFSAYSKEELDAYEKSENFGERSAMSYLAYLAGGTVAVTTGTWWIGMLGGMGTRLLMGTGHKKRENLQTLKERVRTNERVLNNLRRRPSAG